MSDIRTSEHPGAIARPKTLVDDLNGRHHKIAMTLFLLVVVAHWAEHLIQGLQVYVLGWPRPESRGLLGQAFPWLATSEVLHFWFNLSVLAGLIALRPAMTGTARRWWNVALGIQIWHFVEHFLLWGQVIVGVNLLGRSMPTSIIQLLIPGFRVELHLAYNAMVTVPLIVAMVYHRRPREEERPFIRCTCASGG